MKVGDYVIAKVPLWIDSKFSAKAPEGSEGFVTRVWFQEGECLVNVSVSGSIAKGCVPGRHVILHPANGSPLIEALK